MGEARVSFPGDEKWRTPGRKPCSTPHGPHGHPQSLGQLDLFVCHASALVASILQSSVCSRLLGDAPASNRDCDRQPPSA